jgi:molybdopterin-guanine dinucleotide biosynthesis protein
MSTENKTLLQARQMVLIGATGRNSGKTTLALQIIHAFKDTLPVVAFKLITIRNHGDICPRGGQGCGICQGLKGSFDITLETGTGTKDTMLLKKAGANQVYLIRAYKENLREALEEALKLVPKDALILCESNSVRLVAEPALFVMIQSTSSSIKPTAEAVMEYADVILPQDEVCFENFVQGELYQKLKSNFSELNQ